MFDGFSYDRISWRSWKSFKVMSFSSWRRAPNEANSRARAIANDYSLMFIIPLKTYMFKSTCFFWYAFKNFDVVFGNFKACNKPFGLGMGIKQTKIKYWYLTAAKRPFPDKIDLSQYNSRFPKDAIQPFTITCALGTSCKPEWSKLSGVVCSKCQAIDDVHTKVIRGTRVDINNSNHFSGLEVNKAIWCYFGIASNTNRITGTIKVKIKTGGNIGKGRIAGLTNTNLFDVETLRCCIEGFACAIRKRPVDTSTFNVNDLYYDL